MAQVVGDALRQVFMLRTDYESVREEKKLWRKLQRPLTVASLCGIWLIFMSSMGVMLDIVFAVTERDYPFCQKKLSRRSSIYVDKARPQNSFVFTEEQGAQFFWTVVFLPTWIVFSVALVYLFAGILVAYSAPKSHACLFLVENNCCASKRGGVRCLSSINQSFAAVFSLLALVLGMRTLSLETGCSIPLFLAYEVFCWSLVVLLNGTAFLLGQNDTEVRNKGDGYSCEVSGVELLEARAELPKTDCEKEATSTLYASTVLLIDLAASKDVENGTILSAKDAVEGKNNGAILDAPKGSYIKILKDHLVSVALFTYGLKKWFKSSSSERLRVPTVLEFPAARQKQSR